MKYRDTLLSLVTKMVNCGFKRLNLYPTQILTFAICNQLFEFWIGFRFFAPTFYLQKKIKSQKVTIKVSMSFANVFDQLPIEYLVIVSW